MGRTSTARDRLVASACDLIHERGYAAIGVAEICARADVRKGSFYHFFESKQALTVEAVDQHWTGQRAEWAAALAGPDPALDRLERLLRAQASGQAEGKRLHGRVRGCLLGNLAIELSTTDAVVRTRLAAIFDEQIGLVAAAITEAAAEGAVPADTDATATGRAVLAQLEGMVLFAKLADDPDVLALLWTQTRALIGPLVG